MPTLPSDSRNRLERVVVEPRDATEQELLAQVYGDDDSDSGDPSSGEPDRSRDGDTADDELGHD